MVVFFTLFRYIYLFSYEFSHSPSVMPGPSATMFLGTCQKYKFLGSPQICLIRNSGPGAQQSPLLHSHPKQILVQTSFRSNPYYMWQASRKGFLSADDKDPPTEILCPLRESVASPLQVKDLQIRALSVTWRAVQMNTSISALCYLPFLNPARESVAIITWLTGWAVFCAQDPESIL